MVISLLYAFFGHSVCASITKLFIIYEIIDLNLHSLNYCVSRIQRKLISYVNCFDSAQQIDTLDAFDQMLQTDCFFDRSQTLCHCGWRFNIQFQNWILITMVQGKYQWTLGRIKWIRRLFARTVSLSPEEKQWTTGHCLFFVMIGRDQSYTYHLEVIN